jgi:hypothetical protein
MLKHSLPSTDITALREECFAELPIQLSKNFIPNVMGMVPKLDWYTARLNHREYDESKDRPEHFGNNPLGITPDIDTRKITRQLQSSLKVQNGLAIVGKLPDPKYNATLELYNTLKPIAQHFQEILMFSFESDEGLIPHKDGGGGCRIYIPIHPIGKDYSRLEMYYNNDLYYVYHYDEVPKVYLFSQEVPHAIFNQGYPKRYNLQISCKHDYKTMLKILEDFSQ